MSSTSNKGSKLDEYRNEIAYKLNIKRISAQSVFKRMVAKYGIDRIGSKSNFMHYVNENKLKPKSNTTGHPRYEKGPGTQEQVDWKEDISYAVHIYQILLFCTQIFFYLITCFYPILFKFYSRFISYIS